MENLRSVFERADDNVLADADARKVYHPISGRQAYIPVPVNSIWDSYLSNELSKLQNLETGWDGYSSPPVDRHVAFFAGNVLSRIGDLVTSNPFLQLDFVPPPYLVPISGGALQAEWHFGDVFIELVFDKGRPIEACFYSEDKNKQNIDESTELPIHGSTINAVELFGWFDRVRDEQNAKRDAA